MQDGAGASFGIVLEVERPQCRSATVGRIDKPPYPLGTSYGVRASPAPGRLTSADSRISRELFVIAGCHMVSRKCP